MKKILFQGDSITDAGRVRERPTDLGFGYARVSAGRLGVAYPGQYEFVNRGISGNRIVDVYARIKADIINIKPDYMSLLIGVNDVWHEILEGNGVDAEKYEKIYCMLLDEIYAALPDIKIMIMLPYVLEGHATCNTEEQPERYDYFKREVSKRAEVAKKIAKKYNLPYIDLQAEFDKACEKTDTAAYWAHDGVHPTVNGHELIAQAWLRKFPFDC